MSGECSTLSLPENNLPDCWNDEKRMDVLFAPFRNRSVNSRDWDSKLSFWSKLICDCCIFSKVYTFKLTDLQRLFNINGRSPTCLSIVVDEMYKSGDFKPIEQFLQKPAETWSKWATEVFIKKPIVWSYIKIKDTLVTPNADRTYVYLAAVQMEAENMLSLIPQELKNKVLCLQELLDIINVDLKKVDGVKLILHHLVCNGQADVREIESEVKQDVPLHNLLVKFGDIKKIKRISDVDISLHILELNEKSLAKKLETLENEVGAILAEAKSYLLKGHKQMAKNCLRKKREIENRITKKANALQNVQVLLLKVRDTDADAQVLDSYKIALSTLRKSFKETGLSEDLVAETMSELGEVLDIHEDIQASLSQSFTGNDVDLEDELSELIAATTDHKPEPPKPPSPSKSEENDDEELEERLKNLKLPITPTVSPITTKVPLNL